MSNAEGAAQSVPLAALTIEDDLQPRCEIDLGLIEHYAALLMEGVALPPVVVFQEGERLLLADGFHRLRAHQVLERTAIPCLVNTGTRLDAVRYSLSANATHGKPRTRGDMVRAHETAKRFGLMEPGDVARLRELLQCSSAWAFKLTEVDREIARRERNRAIVQKHTEGKSQRQIARETGIPLQTINDVINRVSENSTVEFSDTPSSVKREAPDPPEARAESSSADGLAPAVDACTRSPAEKQRQSEWFAVYEALQAINGLKSVSHLISHPHPTYFYAIRVELPQAAAWMRQFEEDFNRVQRSD